MTKVIILGQEPKQKKPTPIEFLYILKSTFQENVSEIKFTETCQKANHWQEVILLRKNYACGLDLFFCQNPESMKRAIFLGHFNDGVVE
jgi:hypothetical protein